MFKKRTLFIVGAGASKEFGLPVGVELAASISDMLRIRRNTGTGEFEITDRELLRQLQRSDSDRNNAPLYGQAFTLISQGVRLSNSIDDFLDVHRNNQIANKVGKAAIVKAILRAERRSTLHYDRSNFYNKLDMGKVEGTWLIKFVRMLGRNVPLANIDTVFDNVSFLVFNYDRCIEHFLLNALQQLYVIEEQRAAEILGKLNIIHAYGDVGELKTPLQGNGVVFGGNDDDLDYENFASLAGRIRTYTQVKDREARENIDIAIQDAETWVFLGFGFHEQNIRLLKPGGDLLASKRIFATAYAMSENDINVTRGRLLGFFKDASQISVRMQVEKAMHADLTCSALFDYYTQSLPN